MAHLLRRTAIGGLSLSVVVTLGVAAVPASSAATPAAAPSVSLSAVATPSSASRASRPTFKQSSARYGAKSASVRNLQRQLIRKNSATAGLRSAGATGSYYAQTKASVKKFQRKIGYSKARATGIADARSVKRLGLRWVPVATASIQSGGDLPSGTNGVALTPTQLKSVLLAAGFREPSIRTAYGIAMRESRAYPRVVSPKNSNGTRDHGLFQINDVHRATTDFTQIYDPVYNASVAYRLSSAGTSFSHWGIGTSGWAGTLKRDNPTYWQFLQDEMARFRAQYPG